MEYKRAMKKPIQIHYVTFEELEKELFGDFRNIQNINGYNVRGVFEERREYHSDKTMYFYF